MIDLEAFQYLDPKAGVMHGGPILEANTAYLRGKWLLDSRSSVEVKSLAAQAVAIIDIYFESEKEHLIQQIKADGRFDFLETDQNGNTTNRIRDDAIDEYAVYSRGTTSDFEALINAIDIFFDPSLIEDVQDPKDFEIFAAVAMCYLAQYVRDLKVKLDLKSMQWVARTKADYKTDEIVGFASRIFAAMELIGYSQRLYESQRLKERLNQSLNQQSIPNDQLIEEFRQKIILHVEQEKEFDRKQRSAEGNNVRHQKDYEAKKIVLSRWEKNPKEFKTLEEVGKHYEKVLNDMGYPHKKKTVIGWVRIRAPEIGISFGKR